MAGVAPCEDTVYGATPTIIMPHHITQNISTTVLATTKSFVPFCSAQDGKSADINCLVIQAHCQTEKFYQNTKSIIRGFSLILNIFHNMRY